MYSRNNPNSSANSSNNGRNRINETNITLMEMENNQRWAELGEQVDLLKELSKDINQEVKSQNSMLDEMGKTFGNTTELFKSTINKLGIMLTSGNSNHMYYLIVFVVFVFLLLYYMMNHRK